MPTPLPEIQLEAWRRHYAAFWRTLARIEADLAAAGLPSLSWYDALYQLYLAPARRRRMSELARCAILSRSGLTRLVDRLEGQGLIVRRPCPSDGRGQEVELTAAGLARLRRMWRVYREGIARHFAVHLRSGEAGQVAEIFARIPGDEPEPTAPSPRPAATRRRASRG
jgi:DNA-binding MarR family transcriptional regulator